MEIIPADFQIIWLPFLFLAGIATGVCNVLAGGGSLISMPLLIFMGLESSSANGTNRVAITIQNIFAVAGFRRRGYGNIRFCMYLVIPAIPGVVMGTIAASTVDDILFRRILSVVMIFVLMQILYRTKKRNRTISSESSLSLHRKIAVMFSFVLIGFYAGFIQAGVGYLVIASLTSIVNLDLIKTNSYKVFVIGLLNTISVLIFLYYGRIVWSLSLVLAAGTGVGGWLGSHIAVIGGEKWIKIFMTISVTAMALRLSGLF
jgi:uncharacterized protein